MVRDIFILNVIFKCPGHVRFVPLAKPFADGFQLSRGRSVWDRPIEALAQEDAQAASRQDQRSTGLKSRSSHSLKRLLGLGLLGLGLRSRLTRHSR
jgi:hypothetical protein